MARRRLARWSVAAALAALVVAGCGIGANPNASPVTFPPASFGPSAPVSGAVEETRAELVRAFGAAGYQLVDPQNPFRPAESPLLRDAPRRVVQVLLPDDLEHGRISIYDFPSAPEAEAGGREQAAYVASGIGNVQFPPDAQFVIRQVGSTLVFYAWSPENSPDPRTPGVVDVLRTVGAEIPVPS